MNIIWKDIDWLYGYFQVSNTGYIRSIDREIIYSDGRVYIYKGKEYLSSDNKGYRVQNINLHGKQICLRIHREVAKAFLLNPLDLPEVNHKDGDKTNNNDWNLEWCTTSENISHAFRTGLRNSESCGSKLIYSQVNEIREKYIPRKITYKMLAKEYGVCYDTIRLIVNNVTWK